MAWLSLVLAMSLFRVLHASDLHFASVPHQIGIPDLLRAWQQGVPGTWAPTSSQGTIYVDAFAAFAYVNRSGFDVLVLSGDLAMTGGLKDLRAALTFLDRPAVTGYLDARGHPTLQAAGRPLVLIPGNHDRYTPYHFPGGRNFDTAFGAYWSAGQGAQELWVRQRAARRWFFSASTSVCAGTTWVHLRWVFSGAVARIPNGWRSCAR
jgi:3',5'-cyclic AMP phosphodiesterase CpdA